jgi:hypothetical protein
LCARYTLNVVAVYRRDAPHGWPINAADAADLEAKLDTGGHFLPLPKEPAALANVLEVSLQRFIQDAAAGDPTVQVTLGRMFTPTADVPVTTLESRFTKC